jgi:tetratricopeptide (TPR) repeat protein
MKAWDDYFHGPVAAVRPYLLVRSVALLLAFDVFIAMSPHGATYGTAGFNVAHFSWLDALQPLPTPSYYLSFLLFTGLLSMTIACGACHRLLLALLFLSYTYAWMMSRLDSFTHHYLLSLVLFSFVCFPRIDARAVFLDRENQAKEKGHSPRVSAWGYTLLGATAGIVFFYCAMAKVDPTWHAGHTLLAMRGPATLYRPIEELAASMGVSHEMFWRLLSTSVVFLELTLAVCYVVSVRQDNSKRFLVHVCCAVGWVLAAALHIGNEFLDLSIRWFSYHMLVIASVFFLPEKVLLTLARLSSWPSRKLQDWSQGRFGRLTPAHTQKFHVGGGAIVAALCLEFATLVDLPGALAAGLALSVIVLGWTLYDARREGFAVSGARLLATSVAVVTMFLAISQSSAREKFYSLLGADLRLLREHDAAVAAYSKATQYSTNPERTAGLRSELGNILVDQGRHEEAIESFREVVASYPELAAPHYNLARALKRQGQTEEALQHYRTALQLQPNYPEAHTNLGNLLLDQNKTEAAMHHYREALEGDPNLAPAHNNLGSVLERIHQLDEAVEHYREAVRLEPCLANAHANLGRALFTQQHLEGAAKSLREALRIEPADSSSHTTLGKLLRATGEPLKARRHLEEALRLTPDATAPALELARLLIHHVTRTVAGTALGSPGRRKRRRARSGGARHPGGGVRGHR